MSLTLVSLRDVFPEIFPDTSTAVDNEAIRRMIAIDDSYNQGIYRYHDSITGSEINSLYKNNGTSYVLYAHSTGTGGVDRWTEISDLSTDFATKSSELYLRIEDGPNKDKYIRIYDLISLDAEAIRGNGGLAYATLGAKIAAVTFAMSCMKMKTMQLHMEDLQRYNEEMRLMNGVMRKLVEMKDRLSMKDLRNVGSQDFLRDRYTESPSWEVLQFMGKRHLLSQDLLKGKYQTFGEKSRADAAWPIYLRAVSADNTTLYQQAAGLIDLAGDDVQFWADALRIYNDKVGNQQSAGSNEMETQLKMAQQDITVATDFLRNTKKNLDQILPNIR
jgi:hypothetical protein